MTTPTNTPTGANAPALPDFANGLPKLDTRLGIHPDEALLAAWDGYIAATRAYDRAYEVPGVSDKDCEPFSRALYAFGGKVEDTPARTMAGIAIQLRYLFAALVESPEAGRCRDFRKFGSAGGRSGRRPIPHAMADD